MPSAVSPAGSAKDSISIAYTALFVNRFSSFLADFFDFNEKLANWTLKPFIFAKYLFKDTIFSFFLCPASSPPFNGHHTAAPQSTPQPRPRPLSEEGEIAT